jgi:hypothetical protein
MLSKHRTTKTIVTTFTSSPLEKKLEYLLMNIFFENLLLIFSELGRIKLLVFKVFAKKISFEDSEIYKCSFLI